MRNKSLEKRVLLVARHPLVRLGLRDCLPSVCCPRHAVEAACVQSAMRELDQQNFDLLAADLEEPGHEGLELIRQAKCLRPDLRIAVVNASGSPHIAHLAMRAGAIALMSTQDPVDDVVAGLQAALGGSSYRSRSIKTLASDRALANLDVTPREMDVLLLAASGCCNKDIARALQVCVRTVETHRHNIRRKLRIESATDMLRLAIRRGWISV